MTPEDEIERFLRGSAIDRPFQPHHLAAAVSDPAFDEVAAECKLLRLLIQNRTYFKAGFWYSGAVTRSWREKGLARPLGSAGTSTAVGPARAQAAG